MDDRCQLDAAKCIRVTQRTLARFLAAVVLFFCVAGCVAPPRHRLTELSPDASILFYNGPIYADTGQGEYVAYLDRAGGNWLQEIGSGRKLLVHNYGDMTKSSAGRADDHAAPAILALPGGGILFATAYHGTDLHLYEISGMSVRKHREIKGKYTYPMLSMLGNDVVLFARSASERKSGADLVAFSSSDDFSASRPIIASHNGEFVYAAIPYVDAEGLLVSYATHRPEDRSMRDFHVLFLSPDFEEQWSCDLSRLIDGAFYNRPTAAAKKAGKILLGTSWFDEESFLAAEQVVFGRTNAVLIVAGEAGACDSFHVVYEQQVEAPYYNTDVSINASLDFIFFGKGSYYSNLNFDGCIVSGNNIYPRLVGRDFLFYSSMNRGSYGIRNFDNSLSMCRLSAKAPAGNS